MYKPLSLLLLLFSVSSSSFASNLSGEHCFKEQLIAEYEINHQAANHVTVIKAKQQVGIVYAKQKLVELWHQLPNNQVALTRYFTEHKRGIEYQPADLTQHVNWQQLSSQFTPEQIKGIKKINSQGEGCERSEHYVWQDATKVIDLIWLPERNLIKSFQVTAFRAENNAQLEQSWQLTDLKLSGGAIQIAQWQQWPTVDYADIGDNEDDPFLTKMINQGFIKHNGQQFSFEQHQH